MEITCPLCGYPGLLIACEGGYCQVYHRISEVCDVPEELLDPWILEEFKKPRKVVDVEELLEIIRRYRGVRWIK